MASPPTVDFESLLRPISESEPAGVSLKDDPAGSSLYYQIKDAREVARAAEKAIANAVGDEDAQKQAAKERPDWQAVVRLASSALAEKTKDLWIAAWLIEGLVRQHGFAGARDGYRLVRELCENFWDGIHPRPDDDGVATTVAQLAGLNGEGAEGALIAPINGIAITGGSSLRPLTGQDYTDAVDIAAKDPDIRAKRIEQGAATMEMFEISARETPPSYYAELREDIQAAIDEFQKASAVLDEKCGLDANGYPAAPPSSKIASALAESMRRVRALVGEPVDADSPAAEDEPAKGGGPGGAPGVGVIANREDAFKALLRVADFFRRTEPHSPVSYALEQAVRWGRMPLPDLIKDLVSDHGVRREFFRRTGMPIESDD